MTLSITYHTRESLEISHSIVLSLGKIKEQNDRFFLNKTLY